MRLNGWQRLWVVSSVLLAVYLACIEAPAYPNLSPVPVESFQDVEFFEANMQMCYVITKAVTPEQREDCARRFVKPAPSRFTDRQNYELRLKAYQDLGHERREFFGFVLLFWLIPCVVLYAIGWMVAWVVRGFGKPAA